MNQNNKLGRHTKDAALFVSRLNLFVTETMVNSLAKPVE
jgi:hypothetical protein